MALVLTTSLVAAESAEFQPLAEVILQATGPAGVIVDVYARVDGDADWSPVTSWTIATGNFKRIASFPRMRVKIRNNATNASVTVRSS